MPVRRARGKGDRKRIELPEYTDEIWHGYLPDAHPGQIYGYRVHGPYEPDAGHRFNPNKLLLDPYAKQLVGRLRWSEALFGYTIGSADADLSFDERDSAPFVPKSKVIDPAFTWAERPPVRVPWDRTVIYEAHLRGLSMRHPQVPEAVRGTFAGLMNADLLAHIRRLGVTSVELLPIHGFVDDKHLLENGMSNYWGYNSIAFFAPHPAYLASGQVNEFKEMVAHLHDAGLELILDVVYNHTAEGNELGPTLCMRGIDNASYYRLMPDQRRYYINDSGTGNTLDLSHPCVLQMVTDSLRYWATEMRVDGFRFDLATILGRHPDGFDERHGFLVACRQDPVLSKCKLIAEPWDCGPGGYQVGGFPPGWAEWNDRFRDCVRAYWRGDDGMLPELARRLTASGDLYDQRGRRPYASVNFVTAHDGFTLRDVVSYDHKHNEANGENNADGSDHNLSWNHGCEGPHRRPGDPRPAPAPDAQPAVHPAAVPGHPDAGRRRRVQPHPAGQQQCLLPGQRTGLDRLAAGRRGPFAAGLHPAPAGPAPTLSDPAQGALPGRRVQRGAGCQDVTWLAPGGEEMTEEHWHDEHARCLGVLLDGRAQPTGILRSGEDATLLLILNAYHDAVSFRLPEVAEGSGWTCLLDTQRPEDPLGERYPFASEFLVGGRSFLLFELQPPGAGAEG